jgi:hypothetical protein
MTWQDDPIAPSESEGWKNDPVVSPDSFESGGPNVDVGALARGAANNVPLVPQAIAGGHALIDTAKGNTMGENAKALISGHMPGVGEAYSKDLADWNEKAGAAKAESPVSYGTGAVAGALAPLAVPGVGEALEASPVLGNAALGAAGAVSNVDLRKNPGEAAKEAVLGLGTGAGFGKAGELVGEAGQAIKGALSPAAKRLEANSLAGGLDLNSHAIRRLAPGATNPEEAINHISDKIDKLFPGLVGWMDTAGSKLSKIIEGHNKASEVIGQVIDSTSAKVGGHLPEVGGAINNLTNAAEKFNGRTSSANLEARNILSDTAKDLEELSNSGQMNFQNLYEVKKGIGEAFHSSDINKGNKIAYGIVSDTIDNILDRAHVADPSMKPAFDHAKEVFKLTSDLIPSMKPGVAREVAGVGGGIGNAILGGAAITGHPAAIPAYAAKTATKWLAPDLGQNAAYKFVNAMKNAKNVIPNGTKQGLTQEMTDFINSRRKGK